MTNLTEVAFASGFNNYRTFNRAFKQSFALSPSEYKKGFGKEAAARLIRLGFPKTPLSPPSYPHRTPFTAAAKPLLPKA